MNLSENALTVLQERYLWKKRNGRLESPEQMFDRVAKHVAGKSRDLRKRFLNLLCDLDFLPNSPTLMNAGRKDAQLAACFVLPLADDLRSIMETLTTTALIHQSGGGTGFSFSALRPAGSTVKSSHGVAAGPVGFLSLFNELTQTIKQGGLRRGANMGVLSVSHPDIEEFIKCKQDTSRITNFNLSVSVPNRFFKHLKDSKPWPLVDPKTEKTVKGIDPHRLFDLICSAAWHTGEPGIIFIDEVNKQNPTPRLGVIEATNPCGEQPLLPYEACNLGSINLSHVFSPTSQDRVNWNKLSLLVESSVLFLDRVIDTCVYPVLQIGQMCHRNRKIGLGVMGFADLLIMCGIRYGSDESILMGEKIMEFVRSHAIEVSQKLAKLHGPFDDFKHSLWKKRGFKPLRNAAVTTVAPTGTLSLIAGCSAGIEPIFNFEFERHVLDGKVLKEQHPALKDSSLSKEILVNSRDVSPEQHVRVQAAFQRHSDSAVSKTINLAQSATKGDVERAFRLAFELKCKGITVYRDGSRPGQVLQFESCPDCARAIPNQAAAVVGSISSS